MNWAKENKFLTGYGIVMLIGVGVLGYKVYAANSAYDDANDRYTAQAAAYKNLRSAVPYPNKENLAVLEAQKKEAAEVISAFQASLAKREFPLEPMAPEAFQDALKKAVTEVRDRAKTANVDLPKEKFYLGFSRYETAPPDKNASSLLGRDLKAIHWVVDQLVATPILALKDIKRTEIPEEKGGAPATPRPGAAGGNQSAGAGRVPANLLNVHTFEITFNSKQHQLAKVLNTIVSSGAPQFYIIRQIRILNSNQKAPPRATPIVDATVAAPPVPGAPAPLPGAPAPAGAPPIAAVPGIQAPTTIASLVGEETIDTTLRLEIVDFAEPSTPAPAAAPK